MAPSPIINVDEVLADLSVNDKIALLSGSDFWHTAPVAGLPAVRVSDGPNGVRGIQFLNGTPSSCFPCSTGLGSSFDVELAREVGVALGDECRSKGAHVLLAPTVNIQRNPLGGRGFESFSEDPHLSGTVASAYISGVQSKGVAATIKHYVGNDSEFERMSMDSIIGERALREIYLKPFQIALKNSDPWALMTSYNRVNGVHASESQRLLQDILIKEWGFKGLVMSDWTGTVSTVEAILAGQDLEMPGPSVVRGAAVARALTAQKLTVADLDVRVRNVLNLIRRAQESGIPFDHPEESLDTPQLRDLLRRAAADSIVLLKNTHSLLPLTTANSKEAIKSIAVIGPNGKTPIISGGGSAALAPSWTVSPLAAITAAAKEAHGADVKWAVGAPGRKYAPLIDPYLSEGRIEFFNEDPDKGKSVKTEFDTHSKTAFNLFFDGIPSNVNMTCWIKWSATFTPDQDGEWDFGLVLAGQGQLLLDRKVIVDNSVNQKVGELFFGLGSIEERGSVFLKAGQKYKLEAKISNLKPVGKSAPFIARGAMRIGASKIISDDEAVKEAVELASKSDVTILIVGTNHDVESEGFDRKNIDLPDATNRLIKEVLAVNTRTIVLNNSGMPVTMPWLDQASTVVQNFFGGNESGHGLADVLFGKVNPSAKLPVSFPTKLEDSPGFVGFPGENGKLVYGEGIYVGYRHPGFSTIFPFGHGLSYSTFEYSDLSIPSTVNPDGTFTVSVKVKNIGSVPAREVVQVYISDVDATLQRPEQELKAFVKTQQLAPGATETVKMGLTRDALSFYDDLKQEWVAEQGVFEVRVGASSEDIRISKDVKLEKTFKWTGL